MSEKIKIAELARQLAVEAVTEGSGKGTTRLVRCFEEWELSPPTDDDERALFTILDQLLEGELFHAETIPTDDPEDVQGDVEFEVRARAYVQRWKDDLFRGHCGMDERRISRLAFFARALLIQAVVGERELTEFQKRWGCPG